MWIDNRSGFVSSLWPEIIRLSWDQSVQFNHLSFMNEWIFIMIKTLHCWTIFPVFGSDLPRVLQFYIHVVLIELDVFFMVGICCVDLLGDEEDKSMKCLFINCWQERIVDILICRSIMCIFWLVDVTCRLACL